MLALVLQLTAKDPPFSKTPSVCWGFSMSSPSSKLLLGGLIGVAAPGKAGLMSGSYGLLPRMDINDANKLYNGFAKISTGCLNVPNGFNGYLIAFSPDLYIVVQIAINSNGSQMFLRSNWDGWRSWHQVV